MPVSSVDKDLDALTLTLTAHYRAEVKQIWELWADPRKLERWWGPPQYPCTFIEHEMAVGGEMLYKMVGVEDGDEHYGRWRIIAVEPPTYIEIQDVFANADGSPNEELPTTRFEVTIHELDDGRVEMRTVSYFLSIESMEQMVEMGMVEGIKAAAGQIDAILAEA
jgi:uncharacterized protein YndB with AHSA1/START domain